MSDFPTKWQWQYTLLVVSFGVGGLWCILVCVCHLFRTIASTARKNRAIYRCGSRPHDRSTHQLAEDLHNANLLHHGVRLIAQPESISFRPLLLRQLSLPNSSVPPTPPRPALDNQHPAHQTFEPNVFEIRDNFGTLQQYTESPLARRADGRGRVLSRGREERRLASPSWELLTDCAMNEVPPPYDAIEEHFDFPLLPPSYEHLFPETGKS